jgi:hypothetical protein
MAKSSSSSDLSIEEIIVSLDRLNADALELVVNAIGVILQEIWVKAPSFTTVLFGSLLDKKRLDIGIIIA